MSNSTNQTWGSVSLVEPQDLESAPPSRFWTLWASGHRKATAGKWGWWQRWQMKPPKKYSFFYRENDECHWSSQKPSICLGGTKTKPVADVRRYARLSATVFYLFVVYSSSCLIGQLPLFAPWIITVMTFAASSNGEGKTYCWLIRSLVYCLARSPILAACPKKTSNDVVMGQILYHQIRWDFWMFISKKHVFEGVDP